MWGFSNATFQDSFPSFWKIHVQSHVSTFMSKSVFMSHSMMSKQMFLRLSLCSWVRFFGTIIKTPLAYSIHDVIFVLLSFHVHTLAFPHISMNFLKFSGSPCSFGSAGTYVIFNIFLTLTSPSYPLISPNIPLETFRFQKEFERNTLLNFVLTMIEVLIHSRVLDN